MCINPTGGCSRIHFSTNIEHPWAIGTEFSEMYHVGKAGIVLDYDGAGVNSPSNNRKRQSATRLKIGRPCTGEQMHYEGQSKQPALNSLRWPHIGLFLRIEVLIFHQRTPGTWWGAAEVTEASTGASSVLGTVLRGEIFGPTQYLTGQHNPEGQAHAHHRWHWGRVGGTSGEHPDWRQRSWLGSHPPISAVSRDGALHFSAARRGEMLHRKLLSLLQHPPSSRFSHWLRAGGLLTDSHTSAAKPCKLLPAPRTRFPTPPRTTSRRTPRRGFILRFILLLVT